jgi:hypothetical protein
VIARRQLNVEGVLLANGVLVTDRNRPRNLISDM